MNGSQTLLKAWQTQLEARRQRIAQALSQKPASAAVTTRRQQYLTNAQNLVNNHKNWVQAYQAHLQALSQTLGTGASGGAGNKSSNKGSLGE
jgi:hypothetical protein